MRSDVDNGRRRACDPTGRALSSSADRPAGVMILLGVVDEVLREPRLRRLSSLAAGAVREG